jgi:hypothetical protein
MALIKNLARHIPAIRQLQAARDSLLAERAIIESEKASLQVRLSVASRERDLALSKKEAALTQQALAHLERDAAHSAKAYALAQLDAMRDERDDLAKKASLLFVPPPNQAFDHHVSLGYDCEVGFQFKRALGKSHSGFFTWNVSTPESIVSLLTSGFSGILEADNLTPAANGHMAHDASHNFYFHHEFDPEKFKDDIEFSDKLERLRGKFGYFIDGFKRRAKSAQRTVYFYKCITSDAKERSRAIYGALAPYHSGNPFHLVVLQTSESEEPDWNILGISNRYLKRFAPHYDATDAHVGSWDTVFHEFPHIGGMKLADYNVL